MRKIPIILAAVAMLCTLQSCVAFEPYIGHRRPTLFGMIRERKAKREAILRQQEQILQGTSEPAPAVSVGKEEQHFQPGEKRPVPPWEAPKKPVAVGEGVVVTVPVPPPAKVEIREEDIPAKAPVEIPKPPEEVKLPNTVLPANPLNAPTGVNMTPPAPTSIKDLTIAPNEVSLPKPEPAKPPVVVPPPPKPPVVVPPPPKPAPVAPPPVPQALITAPPVKVEPVKPPAPKPEPAKVEPPKLQEEPAPTQPKSRLQNLFGF